VNVVAGIGMIHLVKARYLTAIAYFTKAIQFRPIDPLFFRARAAAYQALNEKDKADDDLKRAAGLEKVFVLKK
jgi:Flp pilus assembly protein TadD